MAIKAGKFSNPFGSGSIYISQTYHSGSNNRYAVDFGSKPAGTSVYAVADGIISNTNTGGGSYCTLNIDNSSLNLFYVHTYKWLKKGTKVKQGQKICEIAPLNINGGYPPHLHLGIEGNAKLMDYFDRLLIFKTAYSDIASDWFVNGKLNWSLFKDLSYLNSTMVFKKGDKIIFTGVQNIRKGSGISYPVTAKSTVGLITSIEDGPREADGYSWYDLVGFDWAADVGKWKLYIAPPVPPVEPPEVPDCTEYIKKIEELTITIEALETQIRQLEIQKKTLQVENERLKVIEQNVEEFNIAHKKLIN